MRGGAQADSDYIKAGSMTSIRTLRYPPHGGKSDRSSGRDLRKSYINYGEGSPSDGALRSGRGPPEALGSMSLFGRARDSPAPAGVKASQKQTVEHIAKLNTMIGQLRAQGGDGERKPPVPTFTRKPVSYLAFIFISVHEFIKDIVINHNPLL